MNLKQKVAYFIEKVGYMIFSLIWKSKWRIGSAASYFLFRWTDKYLHEINIKNITGEKIG
ncbi:MAG: hypothetical protein GF311_23100 [Candidatus Lokiarchaeota archaeon]|nr:hypothetical protein [Candidatus Lokiarchaeota archaeon]